MLIAAAGVIGGIAANSAYASSIGSNPSPVATVPQPAPTQPALNKREVEGRCRFEGAFDSGKGTGFVLECRAEFEADLREERPSLSRSERDDVLRLVCNDERIYNDEVRARLRKEGHDRDLILTGRGGSPRIVVKDVKLPGKDDDRHRATLEFTANGFAYLLQGRCDLGREGDQGPDSYLF